ncbi:McrB family protein [Burkholderia territorii]|uniref:McrB family protein n=1 Tax=Burkholderia territorii TaxID=1503055 RepID=UPI0009BFE009|nr:AAA family ATPase [Burkholderia territorii]
MIKNKDTAEGFEQALLAVVTASSQNSSKGNPIRLWFKENFGVEGRVSLVNEKKQAYNRPGEQLSKREIEHVVFIALDMETISILAKKAVDISYPALKTITMVLYDRNLHRFQPVVVYKNGDSDVADFFEGNYKNIGIDYFEPPMKDKMSQQDLLDVIKDADSPENDLVVNSNIHEGDEILRKVRALLDDGYAGVIFTGVPGTSKSWYAREVGLYLAEGRLRDIFFVQFHPGYQYEDFIESYVPTAEGGFRLDKKVFMRACLAAAENPNRNIVLVIDELTRTDVVRVFGEALTYVENSKRNFKFLLSSGSPLSVPENLILICTMNPWDRGVDDLDLAFERRFAKIEFHPNVEYIREILAGSALSDNEKTKLEKFFYMTSRHSNPTCRIGHAYFSRIVDRDSANRLWDNQLRFHFERALRNDQDEYNKLLSAWNGIFDAKAE